MYRQGDRKHFSGIRKLALNMVRHYRRFKRKARATNMQTQGHGKDGREMSKHECTLHAVFRNVNFEEYYFLSWRVVKDFFKFLVLQKLVSMIRLGFSKKPEMEITKNKNS